jgi:hypothetical protein
MAREATATLTLVRSTSGSARAICRFWFDAIPSATASFSNAWRNAALPLVKKMMRRKARIISFSFQHSRLGLAAIFIFSKTLLTECSLSSGQALWRLR